MKIQLTDTQRTLFMPLWGRARLTRQGNPILSDPKAVELVDQLSEVDFEAIQRSFTDLFNVAWVIRARILDDAVRAFSAAHPRAVIVNIGAGLDTSFQRVDNGTLRWFDLDLPEVIALRRALLPETDRSRCLPGSLLDSAWMDAVQAAGPDVLFLSGGVLYYFEEAQIRDLFRRLAERFSGSEIVFDGISEASIPFVNRGLSASGNAAALVRWGLNDVFSLRAWDERYTLLDAYPIFSRVPDRSLWGEKIAAYMAQSDAANSSFIVHLRF